MVEEWVLALAASPWVYLVMYVFTTIDGIFPPIPSESVVIALAAVAMSTGNPDLALVIAVAAAGAFTGDQVAYAIGRRVHVRSTWMLRGRRAQRTLDWAERALTNRGAAFIIGARYVPVGRVAVNMTAGALGYPRARFVGLAAFAAVSWALYSTAIGVGAGLWLHDRPLVAVVVGVVGGAVIGLAVDGVLALFRGRPKLHRGTAATAPSGPGGEPAAAAVAAAAAVVDAVDVADLSRPAERSGDTGTASAAFSASGTSPLAAPALREPATAMVMPRVDAP